MIQMTEDLITIISSLIAIAAMLFDEDEEEIKRASMSETNKAFGRYMGQDTDADVREVYREAAQVILIEETKKIGGGK